MGVVAVVENALPRSVLDEAVRQLQQAPDAVESLPVTHHFLPAIPGTPQQGVYGREMFIPADMYVAGKIHKYQQMNVLLQGTMLLATEEGTIEVTAPYVVVSPAGVQRIAYSVTDCIWLTIHGTNEQDLDVLEDTFVVDDYAKYLQHVEEQRRLT